MTTGVLPFSEFVTHLGKTQPSEAKEEKTSPASWVCTGFTGAKPYPEHPHHAASTHGHTFRDFIRDASFSVDFISALFLIKKRPPGRAPRVSGLIILS